MSTLRDAAAGFVDVGRALGMADECWQIEQWLRHVLAEEPEVKPAAERLVELLARMTRRRDVCQRAAASAERRANALMAQIEHPGARLARRVLRAARAARQAWAAGALSPPGTPSGRPAPGRWSGGSTTRTTT